MNNNIEDDLIFEKLGELFEVCARLNNEKEYAVFVGISGHVSELKVSVSKGKYNRDYNNIIYERSIYYDSCAFEEIEKIIKKIESMR